MDFFEAQDAARSRSRMLVLLFVVAVALIIAGVYAIVHVLLGRGTEAGIDLELLFMVALGTLTIVIGGSAFRTIQMRQGGSRVAEMLGGRRVRAATSDEAERRLVNVVEEMAIASGTPVPAIYVLDDEPGINAFAAGHTLDDAAVAVTRGTLDQLDRDELQGVIAHEFSHILNGDMRLNIRLIGLLYGILLLAIVGRGLLYSGRGSRSRRGDGAGQIAVVGLGLIVVGYIGVFFGRLIQAAVSRQREYLADASAVQFTRNPGGIAGALTKIGGAGSRLVNHHAQEASHLLFANGLKQSFTGLLATHPPLTGRIQRIDPTFNGEFPVIVPDERRGRLAATGASVSASGRDPWDTSDLATGFAAPAAIRHAAGVEAAVAVPVAGGLTSGGALMASIGAPQPEHVAYASRLLRSLPEPVGIAAHDPDGAVALLFALLYQDHGSAMGLQQEVIEKHGGVPLLEQVTALARAVAPLGPAVRLPLLDLLLPALRELSPTQARQVHATGEVMVVADGRMDMFELALLHILGRQLGVGERGRPAAGAGGVQSFTPIRQEAATVLAAVARSGARDDEAAAAAYAAGRSVLPPLDVAPFAPRAAVPIGEIDDALGQLRTAAPGIRRRFLEACVRAVARDGLVDTQEAELLRAVGEALDCPVPPIPVPA